MAWYNKFGLFDNPTETKVAYLDKTDLVATPEPEEWIWVEGYKGVDWNMQGYGGFQYELGVEYSVEGEVKECHNGLHFSLNLQDAFSYKDRLNHRFFKVKAYVRKQDFENYGYRPRDFYHPYSYSASKRVDKLAAQKIVLVEEITETEDMFKWIRREYPEVDTFNDVKQVRAAGYNNFVKNKYTKILSKYFSALFVEVFIDRFEGNLKTKTNEIVAYMEEGVSKDVAIYLLMK